MTIRSFSAALTTFLALTAACTTEVIEQQAPAPTTAKSPTDPAAAGKTTSIKGVVTVDSVSVYQGVQVRVIDKGEAATRNAPVIANRPALVRVHLDRPTGTKTPKVTVKLHVTSGGTENVLSDGPRVITAYLDNSLDTTFNFPLEAEQVTSDMQIAVEVVDPATKDSVRYPEGTDTVDLQVAVAPKLRVKLIPVKYSADGSNRLPNLDDPGVTAYRDALYQMYPVSDVEITMREKLDWPITVDPLGEGWDQLLNAVMQLRENDGVDDDVYYVGVFNPAATLREYCSKGGCILGVAPVSSVSAALDTELSLRTALVVGYRSDKSGGTLAQELAHAMGRLHAPCGNPKAIDPKFPYKDGTIGTSGWNVMTKELVDSEDHNDFMSYCSPVWVSDYTYKAIHDRMAKVASMLPNATSPGSTSKGSSSPSKGIGALPKSASKVARLTHDQIAWTMGSP